MLVVAAFTAGCGRPPAGGGRPEGDFPVNAVVAEASSETVQSTIQLVGSLKAQDSISIVSEINAAVEKILFNEGETIKAGQVLVRLDDAKLKARLAEAKARYDLADTNFKRGQELFDSQTISKQEYDQVLAEFNVAGAVFNLLNSELSDTKITAPFDGVISQRLVSEGQYLTAGQVVTYLVKMNPLEAEFRVPERFIGQIKTGQKISFHSSSLPDSIISGEIFFIDPIMNADTRTVLVKALIPNPKLDYKPGLFGELDVVLNEKANAVVIPESCVRYAGDQASVVVMNGEGKAEFRNVTVGQRMPGRVEISDGLAAGERVVVEGYQKMGPGSTILISPASEKYGVTPPAQAPVEG